MTIELSDLTNRLSELRNRLVAGEQVVLTDYGEAVGTVVPEKPVATPAVPHRLGFAKDIYYWMAPDFDNPLPDEFWFGEEDET